MIICIIPSLTAICQRRREKRKVGWNRLQFYAFYCSSISLSLFSVSLFLRPPSVCFFIPFPSSYSALLFFWACFVLKSIELYGEEGQDPGVRMAPGCYRAGSSVGLIFRVRPGAFIFSLLELLVFDVNLAQE